MRDIWELQLRLPRRSGKRASELLEHRYFRAAYDFLLLREQAGEIARHFFAKGFEELGEEVLHKLVISPSTSSGQ